MYRNSLNRHLSPWTRDSRCAHLVAPLANSPSIQLETGILAHNVIMLSFSEPFTDFTVNFTDFCPSAAHRQPGQRMQKRSKPKDTTLTLHSTLRDFQHAKLQLSKASASVLDDNELQLLLHHFPPLKDYPCNGEYQAQGVAFSIPQQTRAVHEE